MKTCDICGVPLGRNPMGRPRVRCRDCAADKAAVNRAWRATHQQQIQAYNAARREQTQMRNRAKQDALRRNFGL